MRKLKHWQQLSCASNLKNNKIAKQTRKFTRVLLGDRFPCVYFTQREAQCVYQLILNKKRKQIALLLGLSVRTIEAYITDAKAKTNCQSQKELIQIILKTDFVENYLANNRLKRQAGSKKQSAPHPNNIPLPSSYFSHDHC